MKKIYNVLKTKSSLILHIFFTAIICILGAIFFRKLNYLAIFCNILLALSFIYCLYRMFFKKVYSDSFLKMISIIFIAISVNQLFDRTNFINLFPWIDSLSDFWKIFIVSGIIAFIIFLYNFLVFIENSSIKNMQNQLNPNNTTVQESKTTSPPNITLATEAKKEKEEVFSFVRFLCIFVGFCLILGIPAVLLYFFNKNDMDLSTLEFDKVFAFLTSYGAAFLLILFAIIFVVIVLIYFAQKIKIKLIQLKNLAPNSVDTVPTYVFSIIVVSIILFLAWRITEFSLDDLTDILVDGNYLALPLAIIVLMILFFILVQVTHAIILMLKSLSAKKIKEVVEKYLKEFDLSNRIIGIIKSIIDIILNTIISIFDFIKFVPSFFDSMSKMVLSDDSDKNEDNDNCDESDNKN